MFPIIFGQDGDIITEDANIFPLTPADKRYSRLHKKEVYDFVGFVLYKNKLLTVLPKHFYENRDEEKDKIIDDTKILFNVIKKLSNFLSFRYNRGVYLEYLNSLIAAIVALKASSVASSKV